MNNQPTILFVDDEEYVLNSLRRLFHKEQYNILTALNGKEGLGIMHENNVDIVLVDQNMPVMTGLEFINTVKEKWQDTIRIMLTASDLTKVAREAVTSGKVYRYITKPWNDKEIKEIVRGALLERDLEIGKGKGKLRKPCYTLKMLERLKLKLVEEGLISQEKLNQALHIRNSSEENLGNLLITLNYITEDKLIDFISRHLNIPKVELDKMEVDSSIIEMVPEKIARRYKMIPLNCDRKKISIAIADPVDMVALGDIQAFLGMEINPMICSEVDIVQAINKYYSVKEAAQEDFELPASDEEVEPPLEEETFDVETKEKAPDEMAQEPEVISLVNKIISQAIDERASDIHINPDRNKLRIRYRIDGVLFETKPQPKELYLPVASRLKIMSSLDISKKWIPQDGRIRIKAKRGEIELRVSTYPTVNGESIVLRILDKSSGLVDIPALGFSSEDLNKFNNIINKSHGIFLVTGPTGSGKTTTLYSAIKTLDAKRKNIITVEEPVEYELTDINQGEIYEKKGFGFAHALRAILRHDPDIILIGEIRDIETAQIAFRAAMTGHFVLSTLHTNDAVGTIARLSDLQVEPFLIASSLEAVLSQRLVRKICFQCKEEYIPDPELLEKLDISVDPGSKFCRGKGCKECRGTGYKGRLGIFEIFENKQKISEMICKDRPESELYSLAIREGMTPLKIDGLEKVKKGLTTLEEIIKVL